MQSPTEHADIQETWSGRKVYCFRCGYNWVARGSKKPRMCPCCRSSRYDVPAKKDYKCTSCGFQWEISSVDDKCPNCGKAISGTVEQPRYHCNQCGHEWSSRVEGKPSKCPLCRSRKWDGVKMNQHTCRKCGYVWKSALERPKKCPSCKSQTWDNDTFKLKCFRCGYKWVLSKNVNPDSVKTCPSCRSRRWNELPKAVECFRCGLLFIQKKKEGTCPRCSGSPGFVECTCGFCDTTWVTKDGGKRICPRCGLILSEDEDVSENLTSLYEAGAYRLNYLFKDGIGCVYLWEGSFPIACEYADRLAEGMKMSLDSFLRRVGSEKYNEFWDSVVKKLLEEKNAYRENIPYFMERLGLDGRAAEILALHFIGMSPEAISLRFGTSLKDIRAEFTKIQDAFSTSGIVVNDSVYTKDPISCYDNDDRD